MHLHPYVSHCTYLVKNIEIVSVWNRNGTEMGWHRNDGTKMAGPKRWDQNGWTETMGPK